MDYSQPVVSKILHLVKNVNLQVVCTIHVSTLENILLSYLAHLGRMRRTTTMFNVVL